ncbi:MAG: hypothetical protein WDM84_07920 [Bauldia sp.]
MNKAGELLRTPIDGVVFRPVRPVPHEDGHVTEVARADWDMIREPLVQVHITTTYSGRIRGWGLHERSSDRLVRGERTGQDRRVRRPARFPDLWPRQRVHGQRKEPGPAPDRAEPLPRLEKTSG